MFRPFSDPHVVRILLGCFLVLAAGCRGGSPPVAAAPQPAAPLAPTALLYYDNSGGIRDSVRMVVRDQERFRQIWRQATSTQSAPPAIPAVDFERAMLLVIGAGRMTPEDAVRVDSVSVREETGGEGERSEMLQVVVRTIRGCGGFNADAYPLAIVQVARYEGPVRFVERREAAVGCPGASAGVQAVPLARREVR